MRKPVPISIFLIAFGLVLSAAPAMPQGAKSQVPSATETGADVRYYHLDFVLKELDESGHVVNSRSYHTGISTDGKFSSVRTGTKIPVRTNDKDVQYLDVGVNIDCGFARETPQGLALQITAEISSLPNPVGGGETATPLVRQNKWQSMTLLPIGKPTVVFSSDNLENKGRMQVEVTATRLP